MLKLLKRQLGHDVHPVVQFIKYGMVGGFATGINIAVVFLLGWKLLPCLTADDWLVRLLGLTVVPLDESKRWIPACYCNTAGFVVSNTVCYFLNRLLVFKPGRHRMRVEFALFFAVSGISWGIGLAMQSALIKGFGLQTSTAFAANILCALLINYAVRKFFIFKG